MRCRSEPIQADVLCQGICHSVRTVSDQAGAKQGSSLCTRMFMREVKTILTIGNGIFRVAPIDGIPGKFCVLTKILSSAFAIFTTAAGVAQPGYANDVAYHYISYLVAFFYYLANDLMSGY